MLGERIGPVGISVAVHAGIGAILAAMAVVHLGLESRADIELVVIDVADVEPEPEPEPEPEIEPDPEVPVEPRPDEVPKPVRVNRVEEPKPFQPEVISTGDREAPTDEAVPAPTAPLIAMESTVGGGADVDYVSTARPGGPAVPHAGPGTGAPGAIVSNQGAADVEVAPDWQITSLPRPLNDGAFEPRYPPLARREGREATVLLELYVGSDGRVSKVEVLRGPAGHGFRESAVAYAKRLRFAPARTRTAAVAAKIEWTVHFYARN